MRRVYRRRDPRSAAANVERTMDSDPTRRRATRRVAWPRRSPRSRRCAAGASPPHAPPSGERLVQRRRLRPRRRHGAAGLSEGRPPLHRRHAGPRVRGAHPQHHRRAHPGGDERRRRQRRHRRDGGAVAVGLRARPVGQRSRSPAGARACRARRRSTSPTSATPTPRAPAGRTTSA